MVILLWGLAKKWWMSQSVTIFKHETSAEATMQVEEELPEGDFQVFFQSGVKNYWYEPTTWDLDSQQAAIDNTVLVTPYQRIIPP